MREATECGSGEPFVAEHLGPLFEGQVRRRDQTVSNHPFAIDITIFEQRFADEPAHVSERLTD